jgi:ribosomal protein S18 acetylase RimI-like enzyme
MRLRPPIFYAANRATIADIAAHLARCDAQFIPPLSTRIELDVYAAKIAAHAERFEAWAEDGLAGLIAVYCNDPARRAGFITNVSVVPERGGQGIATRLMRDCVDHVRREGFALLSLRVGQGNGTAIRLYGKCGFTAAAAAAESDIIMTLELTEVSERHARL